MRFQMLSSTLKSRLAVRPFSSNSKDQQFDGKLLFEIREQTRNFDLPEDACGTWGALYEGLEEFEKDTHLHIHKENNILFPMAIEAEQRD